MKQFLPTLLLGLLLGSAGTWFFTRHSARQPDAEKVAVVNAVPSSARGLVHLTADQLAHTGLSIAPPSVSTIQPEVDAYGRVLDPTLLVTAAAEVETAAAALTASEKELARVTSLHDEGNNASVQAVEVAKAAAERDRVQLAAARARFTAAWGAELAAKIAHGGITDAVAKGWALARVDLPAGETVATPVATVRIGLLSGDGKTFEAEVLGPAPSADPQLQGLGFLVLCRDCRFPVGAALRAWLPTAGPAVQLPVLPRGAFVRHEGSVFVFVQSSQDTFQRKRVELGKPLADGVTVLAGISAEDRVVTIGAQQLLSTELGAAGSSD